MNSDTHWDPEKLLEVSGSYWQGSALQAAVRLDIFTQLSDASLSAENLAELLDCDRRALAMLLRALAAMGLLVRDHVGYCCSEPVRYWLDANSSQYLGNIIRHHHHLAASWNQLDRAVRSGQPQRGRGDFGEEEWRRDFLLGMHNLSSMLAPQIIPLLEIGQPQRLLDVGGGPGTWSIHFCRQQPQLRATLFDLPTSAAIADRTITVAGMSERIRFQGGDFHVDSFDNDYDLVWLSHVLHTEGPQAAAALVQKAAAALKPGGLLLVHEFILSNDDEGPLYPALFALNMLLGTEQGCAYSQAEIMQMCRAAGLCQVERVPLPPQSKSGVISARKE